MPARRNAKGLTLQDERFIDEYLIDLNATQAYRRSHAKCSGNRVASVQATRLMAKTSVRAAIAAGIAKRSQGTELTAARVLEELRRLAFLDPAALFDTSGNLKPIHTIPIEARAAIAGLEVLRTNIISGDNAREWLHKVKLTSKTHALELLAKHFKLLTDIVQIDTTEAQLARLDAGRARNAKR